MLQNHKFISNHANNVGSYFWSQHIFIQKLTFDELKVVLKECQLPMLLVLTLIQGEAQKHVIGVSPCVEGNETSHIVDGTYSNA